MAAKPKNTETAETATATATTTEASAPVRVKRMSLANIAPSVENSWVGSVTATIAETNEQVIFSFTTPELSERDARAIAAGYAARLSIAASGEKDAAAIVKALNAEIVTLNGTPADLENGKVAVAPLYTIRGGSAAQSAFTDTIISLALLLKFDTVVNCMFSAEQYASVVADTALLSGVQKQWDAADEAGKKAMVTDAVTKTKRLVGFFKM